jgi:hypothetical protein
MGTYRIPGTIFEDESPVYLFWIVNFVINISNEPAASVLKGIYLSLYSVMTDKATANEFVMKNLEYCISIVGV